MKRRLLCLAAFLLAGAAAARAEVFFTLGGLNGFHGSGGVPPEAFNKLAEVQRSKTAELKCVAFTPSGDWVILFGGNGIWTSNVNLPVVKQLDELQKDPNADVRSIAFAPSGAATIMFGGGFWAEGGTPEGAFNKMVEVGKHGGKLRSIAYAPNGGWVLLTDKTGVHSSGIPVELKKVLDDAHKNHLIVQCVAFTIFGDWICVTNNGWWTSNLGLDLSKLLAAHPADTPKCVAFVPPVDDGKGPYRLITKVSQHVVATLTTDAAHPDAKVDEWVLYAPEVPNLPCQKDVKTTFVPGGTLVQEESPLKRPLILTRITDGRKAVHAVLTIEATLLSRELVRLAPGETAPPVKDLSPELAKILTSASHGMDTDSKAFQDWVTRSGLRRKQDESDMAFAHRGLAYIKHHFTYKWPTPNHTPTETCTGGSSDCGGLSALFVGLMRVNGVPARFVGGRWAASQPDDKNVETHAKSEFFAKGVGWVPVDTSGAVSDTTGGDFACLGHDAGDLIAFANAEDCVVDSFIFGKTTIGLFQGIACWWRGSGPDKNAKFKEWWTVEKK